MKGELAKKAWILVGINLLILLSVLVLGYGAGTRSGGLSVLDAFSQSTGTGVRLLLGGFLCFAVPGLLLYILDIRVIRPVHELTEFCDRLVNGEYHSKVQIDTHDDFGLIADNLNQAMEKIALQEAQESLQKSVTEFLTITSQIARGDLTLRGTVTDDALGNVVDSVNDMLDNFTKLLERVRKAAIDVSTSASEILISSEQMATGATQQDQEITNTSSAVEELTNSMKQVSNNAEASTEASCPIVAPACTRATRSPAACSMTRSIERRSTTRSQEEGGTPHESPVPVPRGTTVSPAVAAARKSADASEVLAGEATNDGTTPATASEEDPSDSAGQAAASAERTAGTTDRSVSI